jgi:hypothetical protein
LVGIDEFWIGFVHESIVPSNQGIAVATVGPNRSGYFFNRSNNMTTGVFVWTLCFNSGAM